MERNAVGRAGEVVAVQHLVRQGWVIIERNWRCSLGEVDIIAHTPEPDTVVVFCEVKCRTGLGFGDPLESITYAKRQKLRQLAAEWLAVSRVHPDGVRIDAIGVVMLPRTLPTLTHVRGIG